MNDDLYLTPDGADKLRKELEELKGPRRDEIAARLRRGPALAGPAFCFPPFA